MGVWFVTGAARGFGRAITEAAYRHGHDVVAATRSGTAYAGDPRTGLLEVALDVTAPAAPQAAVARAVEHWGRIDVLVNNAGYGMMGPIEETSDDEVRRIYDVNVFGLLAVTRAVLPIMRAQRSGRILNIGSMGGFASFGATGVYASTKFAVEGLTESLDAELAPLGIRVTVIEPGAFRTDFMDPSSMVVRAGEPLPDYGAVHELMRTLHEGNHAQPGDPGRAAEAILAVARADDPPRRLPLGRDALARIDRKLATVTEQLGEWREVSSSTDYAS